MSVSIEEDATQQSVSHRAAVRAATQLTLFLRHEAYRQPESTCASDPSG